MGEPRAAARARLRARFYSLLAGAALALLGVTAFGTTSAQAFDPKAVAYVQKAIECKFLLFTDPVEHLRVCGVGPATPFVTLAPGGPGNAPPTVVPASTPPTVTETPPPEEEEEEECVDCESEEFPCYTRTPPA